jgi:hypothetical protein
MGYPRMGWGVTTLGWLLRVWAVVPSLFVRHAVTMPTCAEGVTPLPFRVYGGATVASDRWAALVVGGWGAAVHCTGQPVG